MSSSFIPGATALGMIYSDGIILAADRRASYGTFILSKNARKVFKITDTIGLSSAGVISDTQTIVREAKYGASMFKLQTNREMNAKALAKFISNILFSNRLAPLFTELIVGGFDKGEKSILVLDALGSVIEDKYAAAGSGSELALGILEATYRDGMSYDEAKSQVLKTIRSALERDSASGNGIDMLFISKEKAWEEFVPV
ncbi:MAG TPA: proteasome subunit beta [Thermoproteota archaeon]|nr:proteasome subunit beta [Thermoproteota archaeon]